MLQTVLGGVAENKQQQQEQSQSPATQGMHDRFEPIPLLGTGCCLEMGTLFTGVLISKGMSAGNKVLSSLEG